MRIGIVTYWDASDNYGQLLQCYALQRYLRLQGHDAFLIRYTFKRNLIFRIKNNLLPFVRIVSFFISKEKYHKYSYLCRERKLKKHNSMLNRQRQFELFRQTYLFVSDKTYCSLSALRRNPPSADIYICGSDQIWNTGILQKNGAPYFLDFGDDSIKRIAYAASAGGRRLSQQERDRVYLFLTRFAAISVRDSETKKLCFDCGRQDAVITVDPTLLLPVSEYQNLCSKDCHYKKPYLFIYALNMFSADELHWKEISAYVEKRRLDVRIVYGSGYCSARELLPQHCGMQATIPEWLSLVAHATCMVTTSYHGVIFAIKMNMPFLVILLEGKFSIGNIRIISLLRELGLQDRIYSATRAFSEQMENDIDWQTVNARLEMNVQRSSDFLNKATAV